MKWISCIAVLASLLLAGSVMAADAGGIRGMPQVEIGEQDGAQVQTVKSSIWIDAPPQEVWDCAVKHFDSCWPHSYKTDSHVFIEAWAGGRIWEQFNAEGQGGLYGHVLYVDEPRLMRCDGQWGMGGAAVSGGGWRFEEQDGGTLFSSNGEVMGNLGLADENLELRRQAHADLLLRLKHFVEDGTVVDRAAEAQAAAAGGQS